MDLYEICVRHEINERYDAWKKHFDELTAVKETDRKFDFTQNIQNKESEVVEINGLEKDINTSDGSENLNASSSEDKPSDNSVESKDDIHNKRVSLCRKRLPVADMYLSNTDGMN